MPSYKTDCWELTTNELLQRQREPIAAILQKDIDTYLAKRLKEVVGPTELESVTSTVSR